MSQQDSKPFQWDEIKVRKFAASHLGYPTSTYSASFDRALQDFIGSYPSPSTQSFQWDDNKVKELLAWLPKQPSFGADYSYLIDTFKASHSSSGREGKPEKEWQIIEFKDSVGEIYTEDNNGYWTTKDYRNPHTKEQLIDLGCGISKVKRLSDGVVFSVGDGMTYPGGKDIWSTGKYCKIEHFSIQDGQIYVNSHFAGKEEWTISDWIKAPSPEEKSSVKPPIGIIPEWSWKEQRLKELREAIERCQNRLLNIPAEWKEEEAALTSWLTKMEAKKPQEEKPVLFTTEDGKQIFEEDEYWFVRDNWSVSHCKGTDYCPSIKGNRFSSKELAEEHIITNRKCLSVNDILGLDLDVIVKCNDPKLPFGEIDLIVFQPESLKQLASSKIKGGERI